MKTKVIRDSAGVVINIGEWHESAGPLPDGAYESDAEIVESTDGGLHASENYRPLRAAEYPSIGDQLDALYKAGVFPKDMATKLAEVKAKYPKVTNT